MKKVSVPLNDEKAEELMKIAKEKGESQATIMRLALELFLEKEKNR